jgi:hypothetical protein
MATKFQFLDAASFGVAASSIPGSPVNLDDCRRSWTEHKSQDSLVTLALSRYRFDPGLAEAFEKCEGNLSCVFFQKAEDAQSSAIGFLEKEERGLGVKSHLAKGSTIFTEAFFRAEGAGERLDPLFRFARARLSAGSALDLWVSFQAFLFVALRSLPGQGEKGTGERVDVQVGADGDHVAYSVRFDMAAEQFAAFRRGPGLELPRTCASAMELRYIRDAKKVEVSVLFPLKTTPLGCIEVHTIHISAALDKAAGSGDYTYQTFNSLKGPATEETIVVKGAGFKKKFSAQVKASEEKVADPENGNFLVSGEVLQGTPKVAVSGGNGLGATAIAAAESKVSMLTDQMAALQAQLKRRDEEILGLKSTAAKAPKAPTLSEAAPEEWQKKVADLENVIVDRNSTIEKLSKEIEEIRDPLKRGVVSGLKDNAMKGLEDNINRLKKELEDSGNREKEMLAMLDKAVVIKDEAQKKLKEYEHKLKASSGGNNSKQVMLEKQIEELKRQKSDMSKKYDDLRKEYEAATGKKAA